jgi:hypothetical protein
MVSLLGAPTTQPHCANRLCIAVRPAPIIGDPPAKKKCAPIYELPNKSTGRSGHFATAIAFSLLEGLLALVHALLQASIGQQDLDNRSKLAWATAPDRTRLI